MMPGLPSPGLRVSDLNSPGGHDQLAELSVRPLRSRQIVGSADDRSLIESIAETVRLAASPDAMVPDAERAAAQAGAKDGAVDQPAVKRFAKWVLSVADTGAAQALTPLSTTGTDELLREAERLAIHIWPASDISAGHDAGDAHRNPRTLQVHDVWSAWASRRRHTGFAVTDSHV